MAQPRKDPICIAASQNDTENPATFIFLHGLGDDAEGWVSELWTSTTIQKYTRVLRR
jgi:predicted esterase